MESNDNEEICKYTPVLKRSHYRVSSPQVSEQFIFKKTISFERPKLNFIEDIYVKKKPSHKRKPLIIEPKKRQNNLLISGPILKFKYSDHPRSVSVVPQKIKPKAISRRGELFLPVLTNNAKSQFSS